MVCHQARAWLPVAGLLRYLVKHIARTYCLLGMSTIHVGKLSLQLALKWHMYGRRGFNIPRPARVDVMVDRENVENAR